MAISKILYMKDCGGHFHGKHLKQALDYVMNPEKTQGGRLIEGINCQPEAAFEQMKSTKQRFGKLDKRQGYHLILSFKEGEVTPDIAFEITRKFTEEYLKERYEAVFSVHDNTDHVHSHIIFNSVSYLDGKKYRYEKGDWEKEIQPITNRLCAEYGLSVIEPGEEKEGIPEREEKNPYDKGRFRWNRMIMRDVDACILQADTYDDFIKMLQEKGYLVKQGKYLSLKPPGMERFMRSKTLGERYTEAYIRKRIEEETLTAYRAMQEKQAPKIVKCYVKKYKRAKLSGMQKRYYARLYRIGKLKKKPYSQVWKYRDELRKMESLQKQYLFLVRHNIESVEQLTAVVQNLTDKKKETSSEKSRLYREKDSFRELFRIIDEMAQLEAAHHCYQNGDNFFEDEYAAWMSLERKLSEKGYSMEEVKKLRLFYQEQCSLVNKKERAAYGEWKLGNTILKEMNLKENCLEKIRDTEMEKKMEERAKGLPVH